MSLWLFRAGSSGQYEKQFLDEGRVYLTWENLCHDLSKVGSKKDLSALLTEVYPDLNKNRIRNNTGQIWPVAHEMQPGDIIVLPSKLKSSSIHLGEVAGPYVFNGKAKDPFYHSLKVKWLKTDIPRSNFDQDLLYSFGAFMTVCKITRNDAENRVRAFLKNGKMPLPTQPEGDEEIETVDLERLARDQIAKLIIRKYKGHGLARLVAAILEAQDYTTYTSPEGPDKGIDILAAPGSLGFGRPRICVQVKSGDSPVDTPTLNQLIGAMQNVQADQGLLVSWGGFKSSVDKEVPSQFFKVRLWDQDALITELLAHYDQINEEIRADLPLKRIWTITSAEDDL